MRTLRTPLTRITPTRAGARNMPRSGMPRPVTPGHVRGVLQGSFLWCLHILHREPFYGVGICGIQGIITQSIKIRTRPPGPGGSR
jgi:hypothetical protein